MQNPLLIRSTENLWIWMNFTFGWISKCFFPTCILKILKFGFFSPRTTDWITKLSGHLMLNLNPDNNFSAVNFFFSVEVFSCEVFFHWKFVHKEFRMMNVNFFPFVKSESRVEAALRCFLSKRCENWAIKRKPALSPSAFFRTVEALNIFGLSVLQSMEQSWMNAY